MEERLTGFKTGYDHAAEQKIDNISEVELAPNSIRIIELIR
jgi:hypothetical protein